MAVTTEEIKYIFSGDTSSLSESTAQAIGLLDQYGSEIKKIVKQAKEVSQVSEQVKKSSATFSLLTESVRKAASAMKNLNSSKVSFDSAKKDIATFAATVMLKVATIRYQFDTITMKMQAIKSKAASTFPQLSKLVGTAASAFRRVAKAVSDDSDHILKNIKVTELLKNAKQRLINTSSKLVTNFKNITTSVRETTEGFRGLRIQGIGLKSVFQTLTGYQLGKMFASGIREALHYVEVLNMFNVILDSSTDEVKKFVDAAQEMYGLDPTTIMEMTSTFYNLASAVNAPAEAAKKMSEGLTKTALDLSSLFDVDISQVSQDLTSGMQGMTRAVRKYGLDLRMATLEQTALDYGLKINADTTSEANRQALRYLTIMKQARSSTGDFAKTIESPANQLRILREQFAQLARAIGTFFLPILQKILPYLNGIVMAIRTILQFIAKLIGIGDITFGGMTDAAKDIESVASGVSDIGDAAVSTKKKLKDLIAPFDELNVLNEDTSGADQTGSGAGVGVSDVLDPALAKALEDVDTSLTEIKMKANSVRDAILEFFGISKNEEGELTYNSDQFEQNLIEKFPSWNKSIKALFDNWEGIALGFRDVWNAIGTSIGSVFEGITQGFSNMINSLNLDEKLSKIIESLPSKLQKLADWFNEHQDLFVTIGKVISELAVAFAALKVVSKVTSVLKPLVAVISGLGAPGLIAVGVIVALVGAFTEAWNSSEEFRESISRMVESIGKLLKDLWDVFKPIFDSIKDALKNIWDETLQPLLADIIKLVSDIISAVQPIISFLLKVLAPVIQTVATFVLSIITTVVNTIVGVLDGIIQILDGIINFIAGVFTLNWKRAWEGIKGIFKGIWTSLSSVLKVPLNIIIGMINAVLKGITTVVNYAIRGINKLKITVPNWVPGIGGKKFGFNISELTAYQIPTLATGGVVDSPTYSLIGEGKYPEAVIPLGNSPQMQELIDKIAETVDNKPDDNIPIQVTMYLDGDVVYRNQQKVSRRRGVNFNLGAFER